MYRAAQAARSSRMSSGGASRRTEASVQSTASFSLAAPLQYSSGSSRQVLDRSASVMIQIFAPLSPRG